MIYKNIQILRFIAAFLVVLHHTLPPNVHPAHYANIPAWITEISVYGFAGVDIFFVISGFIMAETTRSMQPGASTASGFVFRRFLRIYSGYWPAFLLVLFLSIWLGIFNAPEISRWKSFLLLPQEFYLLNVSWTLTYELYFYLLIGAMLCFTRKQAVPVFLALLLAFVVIVAVQFNLGVYRSATPRENNFLLNVFLTSPLIIEFIAGFLLSEWIHRKPGQSIAAWSLFTAVALCASIWMQKYGGLMGVGMAAFLYYPERVMLFGSASLGLVALAALLPSSGSLLSRFFCKLGDASYALYLLHIPLLVILYGLLFPKIPGLLWIGGGKLSLLVYLVSVVICSLLYFKFIENPLHKISRRASGMWLRSAESSRTYTV
ncbi:acyltransferase family protein [Delftia tsuruhatensis]|uniref:acyltransferase family protein n=1 Tax=Delftia tsuruhatensis TaxID=180282 RepID=UPI00370A7DFD